MNSRTSLGYFSSINASSIVKGEANLRRVVEEEDMGDLREDDSSPKKAQSLMERPRQNNQAYIKKLDFALQSAGKVRMQNNSVVFTNESRST